MTKQIRNFVIIAHIDHGKSTLADRFLELTGTVAPQKLRSQFLDQMELERERGITIKMQPVRMNYTLNAKPYILNLIDTPGHVDFSYEVSRSLAAVESAILLVDGTQGIQAQTLAHLAIAQELNLKIIGAINKIDLAIPNIDELALEISRLIGGKPEDIFRVSAKTGEGVRELLSAVILETPPPQHSDTEPLRALIFDSRYDPYRGVIAYVRVKEGSVSPGETLCLAASNKPFEVMEVGYFHPELKRSERLSSGEIGYIATGFKDPGVIRVGDTIGAYDLSRRQCAIEPLPGYREPQPLLFAGFYPKDDEGFMTLRDALSKLKLNDAALTFEPERQVGLGKGFRVGFLGALHLEIVKERLKREYGVEPLITLPSVRYRVRDRQNREIWVDTPQELPPADKILEIQEPWVKGRIITPTEYIGSIMILLKQFRGSSTGVETLGAERTLMYFEAPLADLVVNFYDKLKSVTAGYASVAYEIADWRKGDLLKLDILIAGEPSPALSRIVPREYAEALGRATVRKLKEMLPREVFAVPIQAAVWGRIIARETLPALRKDVTGYLYGGDRSRKMKLWKKQQRGKKRLAEMGRVRIKPEVLFEMLKI